MSRFEQHINRQDQASPLPSEHCPACERTTTHARGRCVRCLERIENGKQGWLWIVIGALVLVLGAAFFWVVWDSIDGYAWFGRRGRLRALMLPGFVLAVGTWALGRGLAARLFGRNPE